MPPGLRLERSPEKNQARRVARSPCMFVDHESREDDIEMDDQRLRYLYDEYVALTPRP